MENIITYIILFVFGLTAVFFYQRHKTKQRYLPLSVQIYADAILKVLIEKQNGKTQNFIVQITSRNQVLLNNILVELIDKERNIEPIEMKSEKIAGGKPFRLVKGDQHNFSFDPESFKDFLKKQGKPFSTLRFVVKDTNGKKFKSHELAFNKNWVIYKPDSGKYN